MVSWLSGVCRIWTVSKLARSCGGAGNSYQREQAVFRLKQMGTPGLNALRIMLRFASLRFDAVQALSCLGVHASDVTPALIDATHGKEPANSIALCVLGDIADATHIPAAVTRCIHVARTASSESDRGSGLIGLKCVARSRDPLVVDLAVACLVQMACHPQERVRESSIRTLGYILKESIREHGVHVIKYSQVQQPIVEAQSDSSLLVREAARAVLC